MTQVKVCKLEKPNKSGAVFFNVMIEIPDISAAVLIEGFRYFEGKLYPPAKPWKDGHNYTSVLVSPELARKVYESLVEIGFTDSELDSDTWVSAKWGQAGLKRLCADDTIALSYWEKFFRKKT